MGSEVLLEHRGVRVKKDTLLLGPIMNEVLGAFVVRSEISGGPGDEARFPPCFPSGFPRFRDAAVDRENIRDMPTLAISDRGLLRHGSPPVQDDDVVFASF